MAALYDGAQTCTINPSSYRERFWSDFPAAPRKSKVIVVGAGPAGLEAARVAALRGHEVLLIEARDKVGGALTLWATLPGREFYQKAVDWWESELKLLGVKIRLDTEATAKTILNEKPDAVIVATGARYSVAGRSNHHDLPIPGHEQSFVYRPEDILVGKASLSGKIVILDAEGLHTGIGIAEALAKQGQDVEYLTPYFAPVSPRVIAGLEMPLIMERLRSAGVKISPTTYVKEIRHHEVIAYDVYSEKERTLEGVDAVVLSTGREPINAVEKDLIGKVGQLFAVGDALSARMWAAASYEGHMFARYIGEPNAPKSFGEVYFDPNE
jgi:NADPH-dependent 2,4-dienoyl-CoA reductase/sulfur reductase-like enzyme